MIMKYKCLLYDFKLQQFGSHYQEKPNHQGKSAMEHSCNICRNSFLKDPIVQLGFILDIIKFHTRGPLNVKDFWPLEVGLNDT